MKKTLTIFIMMVQCVVATSAMAAVTVKKAAPVATKQVDKKASASSLLPTVLNLVGTVKQLKQQQRALTDECVPTTSDINFVNRMMQEWAKTGEMSAEEVYYRLGRQRCDVTDGYAADARQAAIMEEADVCVNYFGGTGNDGMIWAGYPRVGIVNDLCSDGSTSCKDKKTVSDIYDIFNIISFTDKDYTVADATTAEKLTNKIEKCSDAKLSARKKELWGNFLTTTINSLGQKQNTTDVMQMVSSFTSNGGLGNLTSGGGLSNIAGRLLGQ